MEIRTETLVKRKCSTCTKRSNSFFCYLPQNAFAQLGSAMIQHSFPRGSTLFMEGQKANGVYLLCSGRTKLLTNSEDGKALIVRIAEPGEVLGLAACISGAPYEASAQVIESCEVNFIRREDLLELFQKESSIAMNALRELSRNFHHAHSQVCSLGLSASAADKLARLLLEWCEANSNGSHSVRFKMGYTHEEIAEMIGSSRETVTRILRSFSNRGLISLARSEMHVPDTKKLARSIGTRGM